MEWHGGDVLKRGVAIAMAMAKHVMNCLFGNSINFRLYDAVVAVAVAALA